MKVEGQNFLMSSMNYLYGNKNDEENSTMKSQGGNVSVLANRINLPQNQILEKQKEARERAAKVVSDAFSGELSLDADLQSRRDRIAQAQEMKARALEELNLIDKEREELREELRIEIDSQEQKDLLLIEKVKASITDGDVTLTEEDWERYYRIQENGLTEYQRRSLTMKNCGGVYRKDLKEANDVIIEENFMIRGIRLERLKSHAIVDASKEADVILESASKEIQNLILEETKENVEESQEETKEIAEEKEEKEKEVEEQLEAIQEKLEKMEALAEGKRIQEESKTQDPETWMLKLMESDQAQLEVEGEVQKIMQEMNLVVEDLKGAFVDIKK